ncbi:hypothetical protein MOE86_19995 [Bacillus atrophaeus]|uniref:response regulator aspartate phosphatase n=1 Tax=Bacillus atrophaeus TaxID=1452 RepID=UPI00227DA84E|nr:hypothetical protein [Bacillus atrophaeus]MCY9198913.1 hypothetical protein [Bacillus atrophaeus]
MKQKIASEEVVHVLNNWYSAIMKREINVAIALKSEIDRMLPDMEDNESVVLYCQMLRLKYSLLLQKPEDTSDFYNNQSGTEVDGMLSYYYYFFKGIYEAYKSNNSAAIDLFKAAESKLNIINDELAVAEFHYSIGTTYYHMKSTILSENHLNRALRIYDKHSDYSRRQLTCGITLALNYIDQSRFKKAEEVLLKCAKTAQSLEDRILFGISVFNLGYSRLKQGDISEAVLYIEQSLAINELQENAPFAYLHGVYEAVRSYFKLENFNRALEWLQIGFTKAAEANQNNFLLKFKTLHSLYVLEDNKKVTECVELLKKKESYVDLEVLALEIAQYYNKKNEYEKSVKYYELSIDATRHILK